MNYRLFAFNRCYFGSSCKDVFRRNTFGNWRRPPHCNGQFEAQRRPSKDYSGCLTVLALALGVKYRLTCLCLAFRCPNTKALFFCGWQESRPILEYLPILLCCIRPIIEDSVSLGVSSEKHYSRGMLTDPEAQWQEEGIICVWMSAFGKKSAQKENYNKSKVSFQIETPGFFFFFKGSEGIGLAYINIYLKMKYCIILY